MPNPESGRSLRVLFCNYEYPPLGGGGSTASRYLANELALRGHQVEVVTTWFRGLPREEKEAGLHVRRLPALRSHPARCRPYQMASYSLLAASYLLFRGGPKADVIVSYHSIPSGLAGWPASLIYRTPHVVLFRGGDVPGFLPEVMKTYHARTLWLNRWIVYQSAAALANSDGLAEMAQRAFPKKNDRRSPQWRGCIFIPSSRIPRSQAGCSFSVAFCWKNGPAKGA